MRSASGRKEARYFKMNTFYTFALSCNKLVCFYGYCFKEAKYNTESFSDIRADKIWSPM